MKTHRIIVWELELVEGEDVMFVPCFVQIRNVDPAACVGLIVGEDSSRRRSVLVFYEYCNTEVFFFWQLNDNIIFPTEVNRLLRSRQYITEWKIREIINILKIGESSAYFLWER